MKYYKVNYNFSSLGNSPKGVNFGREPKLSDCPEGWTMEIVEGSLLIWAYVYKEITKSEALQSLQKGEMIFCTNDQKFYLNTGYGRGGQRHMDILHHIKNGDSIDQFTKETNWGF